MFAHLNDDVLFGEVWNEEAIDVKTKCIVTVVSLMASGITDSSLGYHLQNAKNNGVTREEIAAIINRRHHHPRRHVCGLAQGLGGIPPGQGDLERDRARVRGRQQRAEQVRSMEMRKGIALLLMISLALVCAGCGSAPAQTASEPVPAQAPEQAPAETPAPVQEQAPTEAPASVQEPESTTQTAAAEEAAEAEAHSSVLVVYFSATGTTRGVAERIAALTGADLAEIVPAQPYTTEDLNYNDRTTRATVEQNLEGYTTIYLGYPIWWGQAPRIMSTFVESHDFTGLTVIPFCTSGSSGAGRTGETLGEQAGTGTFLSSTRLSGGISDSELQSWIGQ